MIVESWSSGRVESQINRLTVVECRKYGRSNPNLLNVRIVAVHSGPLADTAGLAIVDPKPVVRAAIAE